jgi:hypothetical protein
MQVIPAVIFQHFYRKFPKSRIEGPDPAKLRALIKFISIILEELNQRLGVTSEQLDSVMKGVATMRGLYHKFLAEVNVYLIRKG